MQFRDCKLLGSRRNVLLRLSHFQWKADNLEAIFSKFSTYPNSFPPLSQEEGEGIFLKGRAHQPTA